MTWTILVVAGMGAMIGLRYKVPAVLLASFCVASVATAASYHSGQTAQQTMVTALVHVAMLQGGYLFGLTCLHWLRWRN